MPRLRLSSFFYRAARTSRDLEALGSGDPKRIVRRAKNRTLGRFLARLLRPLWR